MNWTKTPPTEPGLYYWRMDDKHSWEALRIGKFFNQLKVRVADRTLIVNSIGGFWGGRVPAPGTTFSVDEVWIWMTYLDTVIWKTAHRLSKDDLYSPVHGLAATTAQHGKEQG